MENEIIFETQEKILRKVAPSGNGAHIFAPKEWIDEEVLVVRISKLDIKKEVLKILEPYMENIISVILFGSYAREEQNKASDVDILVISSHKFSVKKKGFDIIIIEKDKLDKAMKLNPVLIYSAINEGVALVNSLFLNELEKKKININVFKEFIISSRENLKSNKEILELDELQNENFASDSVIYSLYLRLRGIFIINCLISSRRYSNYLFQKWLSEEISSLNYNDFYSVYISIRDNKKTLDRISIKTGNSLVELLKNELNKISYKHDK